MLMMGALTSDHILNQIKQASKPATKKYEDKELVMIVDEKNQDLHIAASRREMREKNLWHRASKVFV